MQKFQCYDCNKSVRFCDSDIANNDFEIFTDRERQQVGWHYLVNGRATHVIVCGECFDVREGLDFDMLGFQAVLEETSKRTLVHDEHPEIMTSPRKSYRSAP